MSRQRPAAPACRQAATFVAKNHGSQTLAPLTGQDARAFRAFAHLVELYSCADGPGQRAALRAMRATLEAMQEKCRDVCKRAIPCMMDWSDEERLWSLIQAGAAGRMPAADAYSCRCPAPHSGECTDCAAVNPATGSKCGLVAGHPNEHISAARMPDHGGSTDDVETWTDAERQG